MAGWPVGLRRAAGPATVRPGRVRDLAAAAPAAFVVFDLLADRGTDLRGHPYIERRAALETLLGRGLPPGVVLTPTTSDPAVAHGWLAGHAASGIEGVVAKQADHPYRSGVRRCGRAGRSDGAAGAAVLAKLVDGIVAIAQAVVVAAAWLAHPTAA